MILEHNTRSGKYVTNEKQLKLAQETKKAYEIILAENGFKPITTEIKEIKNFFFAEEYHPAMIWQKIQEATAGMVDVGSSLI